MNRSCDRILLPDITLIHHIICTRSVLQIAVSQPYSMDNFLLDGITVQAHGIRGMRGVSDEIVYSPIG